ncbi:MAG: UDP-N-acetylmuramoylalanine--D-glutamate ligase [Methylophagaceae bacterium]|jgi:UDP-N-acetylmuramoylalanine--D-glutamate ligase
MINNKQKFTETFLIIGLGQTGLSCARFLVKKGYVVAVMDTRDKPPALEVLQAELPEVLVRTGGLSHDWMLRSDTIILSPGVDPRLPEIKAARELGIEIIGDVELFTRYITEPVIAITGSNGKSTVTTMIAEMAVMAGKNVQVGGNLGVPALELIIEPGPDFYILELSSFQLETVSSLNAKAAVVLNISPDHLDRYDNLQQYQNAKAKIYVGSDTMIINRDDPVVNSWPRDDRRQIGFTLNTPKDNEFGLIRDEGQTYLAQGQQKLIDTEKLQITGKHNMANALAALALGNAMALPMGAMLQSISEYRGLPHRCQLVEKQDGIRWINDSKATNVGACIAAIEGLANNKNIILIAGGIAKDQEFSALNPVLSEYVKTILIIGQDAKLIAESVPDNVMQYYCQDMASALEQAKLEAVKGDTVLLSPACASFDMYDNYIKRGDSFIHSVEELLT